MLPATDGHLLLHLALIAAFALGLVSLLLMLQVLVISQASARRQRHRAAFQAQWRSWLAAEALGLGDAPLRAPATLQEQRWWLQLWNQLQGTMRGESHARLNRLLRSLKLDRLAVELLERRDVRARLVALACFRELGDPGYWELLSPLLQSRHPILSLAAADALVTIDPERAMRQVLPAAMRRPDWARGRLAWLCRRAGPAAVTPPLLELLRRRLPEAQRGRLLALVEHADPRAMAPWARRRLDDPGSGLDEAAGALQVLGALGDPADHARMAEATRDADAGVRLAATAALRSLARPDDAGLFMPLLADRTWAVRQEAATALATLPGLDDAALGALAADVFDRYGREALQRAIAEHRG